MVPYTDYPGSCTLYSVLAFVIVASAVSVISRRALCRIDRGCYGSNGGYFLGTSFKYAVIFLVYLIVMQIRPKGCSDGKDKNIFKENVFALVLLAIFIIVPNCWQKCRYT